MKEGLDFCFKDGQGKYNDITKSAAAWVNNTSRHDISFDKNL